MYTAGIYFSYNYILYRSPVILRKEAWGRKLGNAIQFQLQVHLTTVEKYFIIERSSVEFSWLTKFEKFLLRKAEYKI